MPFDQRIPRAFTAASVQSYAPAAPGVYGISNAREWIYIGRADSIQAALLDHLRDSNSAIQQRKPTGFAFEICAGNLRRVREDRLIQEYRPVCTQAQTSPKTDRVAKEAIMLTKKTSASRFVLTGFSHDQDFREFTFEGIAEDYGRTPFTVRANLTLARTYGIHFQDLPLLCREFLELRTVTDDTRLLTFGEEDMRLYQADRLAAKLAAAQKRRAPARRPAVENTGNAWRTAPQNIQRGA